MANSDLKKMGLEGDSFLELEQDRQVMQRVIANVEAEQKVGKDHWCFGAPDPILVLNIDQGIDGVVQKFLQKGKRIIVSGMPLTDEEKRRKIMPSYVFARPQLKSGETRKSKEYVKRVQSEASPIFEQFIHDYQMALESKVRTIMVDTGGGAYTLAKFAFVGMDKYTTKDDPYGQKSGEMKAIFQGLVAQAYDYDKNVLWLHRLKQKWAGGEPVPGKYDAQGYPDIRYEVQLSIRLGKKVSRGETERWCELQDVRLNDAEALEGMRFEGKRNRFSSVMATVFETDEEDWE